MPTYPVVPTFITVHLGLPDSSAPNVTVPFTSYIKNVASHELYPTWPEAALRANIMAQISFALNRVYTEFYRSRGYDFDITSTTQRDQAYVPGGNVFENISQIVDDIFNNYIVRQGNIEPLSSQKAVSKKRLFSQRGAGFFLPSLNSAPGFSTGVILFHRGFSTKKEKKAKLPKIFPRPVHGQSPNIPCGIFA